MLGDERIRLRVREERPLAEERDERRVAHDAREHRRHQRVGLEVVAVQDLDGQERRAEGRAKDGRHARGRPRDEQDAPLAVGDAKHLSDERADRAPHLHRGALAPARAARAERQDRDDRLHEGHALADDAAVIVERLDDRVAAAAARLGGEPRRDDAREQRPDRGEDEQEPRAERRPGRRLAEDALARGAEREVPRERLEPDALHALDAGEEERAEEPGGRADERRVQQHAPEDLELDRGRGGAQEALERPQPPLRGALQPGGRFSHGPGQASARPGSRPAGRA